MVLRVTLLVMLHGILCAALAQNAHDARILSYEGIGYACEGEVVPRLKVRNEGSTTMFTCVVETWKNGLQMNSFNWELAVAALQGDVREPLLPPVEAQAGDMLEFRIISVNAVPDQEQDGNLLVLEMAGDPTLAESYVVMVETLTDASPEQTTWAIHDAAGALFAEGGPYDMANTVYQRWLNLEASNCYDLRAFDSAVNGLNGGHVKLFSAGNPIVELTLPTSVGELRQGFVTGTTVGVPEYGERALLVAPVPTAGPLRVSARAPVDPGSTVRLFDLAGRDVLSGTVIGADRTVELDLGALPTGPYLLVLGVLDGAQLKALVLRE